MLSLIEAVKRFLPDQKIIKTHKVTLSDSWSTPLSKTKFWYITPLDMIETENFILFDRRHPFQKANVVSVFTGPILLGGAAFLLWKFIWRQTPESFNLVIFAFAFGIVPPIVNYVINQGLTNILTIKKEWVTTMTDQSETNIIEGTIPKDESYSFTWFLNRGDQQKLTVLEKFFSGLYFKNLIPQLFRASFKFSYKEI